MLANGRHYRTIWLKDDDPRRRPDHRPTRPAPPVRRRGPGDGRADGRRDRRHAPARRRADRRGRRLRHVPRRARARPASARPKPSWPRLRHGRRAADRAPGPPPSTWSGRSTGSWRPSRPPASDPELRIQAALDTAQAIADEDADFCRRIGQNGEGADPRRSAAAKAARRSTSSPTAMRAGSPSSTTARPPRPSTPRTRRAFPSTCGWTKPGRATRAPGSPPGKWCSRASRTPSSPTMSAAT